MIELKNVESVKIITDIEVFRYYLGDFNIGESILSPLRQESRPSFCIFYHNEGKGLRWKDFGTGESGDAIELVRRLFGISYGAAVKKAELDLKTGFSGFIGIPDIVKQKGYTNIQIKKR